LSRRWVLTGGLLTFDFGGAQQMVKYVVTGMTLEEEMGGDRPAWLVGGWPAWLVRKEEGLSGDESRAMGKADGRRKKGDGGK
jgi:hypothetical protein